MPKISLPKCMHYYFVNSLLSFAALCLHAVLFRTKEPFFFNFYWDQLAKIRQYHWKGRPKISKVAKSKNDLLKANKDTCIAPQSHNILQRDKFVSLTTQASVKFHNFAEQCHRSLVN